MVSVRNDNGAADVRALAAEHRASVAQLRGELADIAAQAAAERWLMASRPGGGDGGGDNGETARPLAPIPVLLALRDAAPRGTRLRALATMAAAETFPRVGRDYPGAAEYAAAELAAGIDNGGGELARELPEGATRRLRGETAAAERARLAAEHSPPAPRVERRFVLDPVTGAPRRGDVDAFDAAAAREHSAELRLATFRIAPPRPRCKLTRKRRSWERCQRRAVSWCKRVAAAELAAERCNAELRALAAELAERGETAAAERCALAARCPRWNAAGAPRVDIATTRAERERRAVARERRARKRAAAELAADATLAGNAALAAIYAIMAETL